MDHDKSVCTDDNRRHFLCSSGWRFWPADKSFTKDGVDGRLDVDAAFKEETADLTTCPVCKAGDHLL